MKRIRNDSMRQEKNRTSHGGEGVGAEGKGGTGGPLIDTQLQLYRQGPSQSLEKRS